MSEWISVIAALAGAAIGGLISYVATLATIAREEKSEKRAIILSKLEETHKVVRDIRQHYKESYSKIYPELLLGVKLPENDFNLLEIDRLAMLVDFYFPELTSVSKNMEAKRINYGAILAESITRKLKHSRPSKEIAQDLSIKYDELDKSIEEFLNAVAVAARKRVKV